MSLQRHWIRQLENVRDAAMENVFYYWWGNDFPSRTCGSFPRQPRAIHGTLVLSCQHMGAIDSTPRSHPTSPRCGESGEIGGVVSPSTKQPGRECNRLLYCHNY